MQASISDQIIWTINLTTKVSILASNHRGVLILVSTEMNSILMEVALKQILMTLYQREMLT